HQVTKSPAADQYHGRALLQKKQAGEAVSYFSDEGRLGFRDLAYSLIGKRAEAEALRTSAKFPNHLALICAGLGDKDCVFEALNQIADIKDPRIHFYIVYPEARPDSGRPAAGRLKKEDRFIEDSQDSTHGHEALHSLAGEYFTGVDVAARVYSDHVESEELT